MLEPIVVGKEIWVGILGPSLIILVQWYANHRKGMARDAAGSVDKQSKNLALDRIERVVIDVQKETRASFAALETRLDSVSEVAHEALAHAIGPDGRNGLRSRVESLERRTGEEDRRTRDHRAQP